MRQVIAPRKFVQNPAWGSAQDLDPRTRWSPRQAAQHPFVTNKRFTGPFQPPPDPHLPLRLPEPADGSAPGVAGSPYGGGGGGPYAYAPPMAAGMATSPEAHATAHAAALAALQVRVYLHILDLCVYMGAARFGALALHAPEAGFSTSLSEFCAPCDWLP